MYVDEDEKCVFYPSSGAGGQVLAMNGIPSIEVCSNITFTYKIVNVFRVILRIRAMFFCLRRQHHDKLWELLVGESKNA